MKKFIILFSAICCFSSLLAMENEDENNNNEKSKRPITVIVSPDKKDSNTLEEIKNELNKLKSFTLANLYEQGLKIKQQEKEINEIKRMLLIFFTAFGGNFSAQKPTSPAQQPFTIIHNDGQQKKNNSNQTNNNQNN